jgi:tetratricopeptide (TPR) repeat protein
MLINVSVLKNILIYGLIAVIVLLLQLLPGGHRGVVSSAVIPFNLVPESDITVMDRLPVKWKILWDEARQLARSGDYSGAIIKYESLLSQKGNIQEARWELARIHMYLKHWDEAARILELLIESDPEKSAYLNGLGRVMWEKGLYDRATDLFKRAHELNPTDGTALAGLVEGLLKLGKKEEALPFLEELHRQQPDNIGIHRYLAMLTYELALYEKARPLLSELAEMKEADLEILLQTARVHDELGLVIIAGRYWRQILEREPDNNTAHIRLAEIYEKKERYHEALPHIVFLLKHEPESSELMARIGRAYARTGQYEKALTFYGRYLKIKPDDPDVLRAVVKIEAALGKKKETLAALERYFQVEPETVPADLKLAARLYDAAGRFHKAIPLYRKLIELSPEDPELLASLASDLLAIGENEGALSMWKDMARLVDDPLTVYRPMADLLARLGRDDELIEVFEKIHLLDPQDLRVIMQLAVLYLEKGQLRLAADMLTKLADAGYRGDDYLLARGKLFVLLDKPEYALRDYEIFLDRHPDRHDIRLRAAGLAGELGLFAKAKWQFDTVRAVEKKNTTREQMLEYRFARTQALMVSGFYRKAIDEYRSILSVPDDGKASAVNNLKERTWLALADTYRLANLTYEEEQVLREALNDGCCRALFVSALFEAALRNGRLDDAEAWLADLRKKYGGQGNIYDERMTDWQLELFEARLLAARGSYRAAIAKGRQLFAEFSTDSMPGGAMMENQHPRLLIGLALGRFFLNYGKLIQASNVGKLLLAEGWRHYEIYVLLQQIYMQSLDQEAEQKMHDLLVMDFWDGDENTADLGELFRLIALYDDYGNPFMKNRYAEAAYRKASDSMKARILLAETRIEQNRSTEAYKLLSETVADNPDNIRFLTDLTKLTFSNGKTAEALAHCDAILTQQPQRADMLLFKARITWAEHKWNEAIAIYKSFLEPSANTVLSERLAEKGVVLDLAPKSTFWNVITFTEGEVPELAAVVMSAPYVLSESEENSTVNSLAIPLYAQYRWQQVFADELAARQSIQRRQYNQAASQLEMLLEETEGDDSLFFDLAGVYNRLERLEEEAALYERMQSVNPVFPGLKSAIERNRLQRRPHLSLRYGFDEEEGWDYYKAIKKKWGETTARFSPKTRHEVGLAYSRIKYQATNNDGKLWANRAEVSYKATLTHELSTAFTVGVEDPDGNYASTPILSFLVDGRIGDTLNGHFSFNRDVTADTIASLRRNITHDSYWAGFSADFFPRLALGADFGLKKFEDSNQTDRYNLWSSYIFFFDPTYFRFKFNYTFADSRYGPSPGPPLDDGFAKDDHPYWSPQNYWLSEFSLYFRHQLASDTLGRGVPKYYTVEYTWGYDANDDDLQSLSSSLFLEVTQNVILQGSAALSSLGTYQSKELLFSAAYRW